MNRVIDTANLAERGSQMPAQPVGERANCHPYFRPPSLFLSFPIGPKGASWSVFTAKTNILSSSSMANHRSRSLNPNWR
jgi:hypothetical protein